MDTLEKLNEATRCFSEAKELLSKNDATAEEVEKRDKLFATAIRLRDEAAKLVDIEESAKTLQGMATKQTEKENKDKPVPQEAKGWNKDWAAFLYAAWRANHKSASMRYTDPRLVWAPDEKEPGMEKKENVEAVGASGGFLVPAEFLAQLQSVMAESTLVRPRSTIIRMNRRQIGLPVLDQTHTTAGQPHWFGGMRFYWGEEAALKTETNPEFREIQLVAHKLYGYTTASDELVSDSAISFADFMSGPMGFAGGVAWMEDYAFFQGTGAGQPLGIINAGATISVAAQQQPPAAATLYQDFANMMEHFLPTGRGAWFITQSLYSEMLQMQDPGGFYVWQPSARDGVPSSLFGFPVYFTEKLPLLGTAGCVVLADLRYYLIGDRQATTIESTQYDLWRYDKTSWRVVHRVDGQPWLSTWLTLQDGSSTISPFVILGSKPT